VLLNRLPLELKKWLEISESNNTRGRTAVIVKPSEA
jgi:hypothetical protein